MSPITAANLVLVGGSLLLLDTRRAGLRRLLEALALLAAMAALLALVGYSYGAERLYQLPGFASMAFPTAATFVLLAVGILSARTDGLAAAFASTGLGGRLARRLLPWVIAAPLVIGWLALRGERAGLFDHTQKTTVVVASMVFLLVALVWRSARSLGASDAERTRAEQALRGKEEQLALITSITPVALTQCSRDQRYVFVNRAYAQILGLAPEEIMGHQIVEIMGEKAYATILPHVERVLRGETVEYEDEVPFKGAGSRFLSVTYVPQRNELGEVVGWVASIRDITERKEAEAVLREREERFRRVFEHAVTGIAITDLQGRFEQCNPAYCALLGYTEEEFHELHFPSLIHPDDREANMIEVRRLLAGEIPHFEIENRYLRKDGESVWVRKFGSCLPDETGKPAHMMALVTDMTEQKRAEAALRESEERYRQLVHALPVAVYSCDAKGRISLFNAAAVSLWGREPKIGHDRWCGSHRLFTPDGKRLPHARCPMALSIKQDEPIRDAELIVERPNGSRSHVLAFPDPIHDSSGAVTGAVNMLVDITARKETENALHTSERKLRTLARTVEQSPASVLITSPSGEIEYVNRKFTEVTGYSREEVLGKNPRLLKSGVQPAELYKELWKTITAGRDWRSELCNRKKSGELFWEFAVIAPIQDEHGTVTHFVAIKEDITERKQTEKALAESRQRFAGIVESAMDAIISVDTRQRIILFNAAAEEMFGCAASEAVGTSIDRFIPKRFYAAHEGHIRRFGETGVTSRAMGHLGAISGLRADGEEFPIEASISQMEVGGEKLFTVILRDITRRIQLEREVLEISTREQRRIGQDLHDDLCQWLAGTEFLADALAKNLADRSPADAARARKIADSMRQANVRARTLAHGLTPAVIESAGLTGALRELAAGATEMFGVRCNYDGPETLLVRDEIAALHLYRIAQEAISNAVRHGGAREVHIFLKPGEDRVTMLIRDDGSGIPDPHPETNGMGLRTMRYRAGIIGATLEIRPSASGGTEIACTFPKEL